MEVGGRRGGSEGESGKARLVLLREVNHECHVMGICAKTLGASALQVDVKFRLLHDPVTPQHPS